MDLFGLEAPLSLWSDMNSSNCSSQEKPAPVGHRIHSCKFASFASARDLKYFEMENEKEDSFSPRCVLDACKRRLDPESENIVSRPVTPKSNQHENSHWRGIFKILKKGTVKRLPSFPPLVPSMSRRHSRSVRDNVDSGFCSLKSSWKNFTLSELKNATNNFSQENVIGKGGYAEVYKGCLPDGQLVAIKRLNKGTDEDQIIGFLSEIGTIAHVDHPNTAKLIGFGVEGGSYLVLKLSPLGSLGSLLRGSKEKLNWAARFKIILGTAAGLQYLHENCQRRIIHRDIKADNILLTEDFEPQVKDIHDSIATCRLQIRHLGNRLPGNRSKICDFGLAKWLPNEWTHHNIPKFEGTFGYFAPEYFMHGIVDEKTDVFSYGVLLLELITGREALDESQKSLVIWSKPLLDDNNVKELIDPSLNGNYDPKEMDCVILTASLCTEHSSILRPRMSQVLTLLRGENQIPDHPKGHDKRSLQRTFSKEIFDAEEYNSTKYLNDISRHKTLAFGS